MLKLRDTPVKGTKKLIAGLDWLVALGPHERTLSANELRKNICREGTPAGDLLRTCLRTVSGYTVGVTSKSYLLNVDRLFELRQKYGLDRGMPTVLKHGETKMRYLATVKLNPFNAGIPREAGTKKGHRYYTAVTSMEEEVRAALIGHGFDYDITASCATLLYQLYLKTGGEALPTWQALVTDRTKFRTELVEFSGIPMAKIKTMIAGILNGAYFAKHRENSIWNIFRTAFAKVSWEDFIQHPHLCGLINEGKVLYAALVPKAERVKLEGKTRVQSRGWHQYQLYEKLEDTIMSVVSVVLGDDDVWFIHDGFMRRERMSREKFRELISRVKAETGYDIELEETELKGDA